MLLILILKLSPWVVLTYQHCISFIKYHVQQANFDEGYWLTDSETSAYIGYST